MHDRVSLKCVLGSVVAIGMCSGSARAQSAAMDNSPADAPVAATSANNAASSHDSAAAAAAAPADVLQEIIVTANRRKENVQDVSASISVLGGENLEANGIANSRDLGMVAPNVTVNTTFTASNPRIYIRGVGTADFNPNASLPIGIYVDEVYIGSTNALQFQLFDIDRVEVLRGPQGTLYGRNSTGGAINYISRAPTGTFTGYVTARAGNFGDRAVEAAVSGPLWADRVTGRLAVAGETRNGTTTNRLTGRPTGNDINSLSARGILDFKITDDLNIDVSAHGGHADPHAGVYKPRGTINPATGAPCTTSQILQWRCANILGYQDTSDPWSVANDVVGRELVNTGGASLKVLDNLGWANLVAISGYERVQLRRHEDSDGGPLNILQIDYHENHDQLSQELRLVSPGGQFIDWIVGAYYYYERVEADNDYNVLGQLEPLLGFAPASFVFDEAQQFTQQTHAYATFGRMDLHATDRLKISLGLRYTHETRGLEEDVGFIHPTGFTEPPSFIPLANVTRGLSNAKPSGDFSVNYRLTDGMSAYATISRGFRSGGFNGAVPLPPNPASQITSVRPETLTNYEAGIKTLFLDNRASFDASAFNYNYRDLQVYTIESANGLPTQVLDNAANAKDYGLEAQGSLLVTRGLKLSAGLGLLSTKFEDFRSLTGSNYSGNPLPGAPKTTFSASIDYQKPLFGHYQWFTNINTAYRGHLYFDATNDPTVAQGGFWLTNLKTGFGSADGKWDVALWGRNLFNKLYYRDIINFASTFGFQAISVGDPATYGAEVTVNF